MLIAELTYQQTQITRMQAQAARYTDTAALFQALGGGWWNRDGTEGAPRTSARAAIHRLRRRAWPNYTARRSFSAR